MKTFQLICFIAICIAASLAAEDEITTTTISADEKEFGTTTPAIEIEIAQKPAVALMSRAQMDLLQQCRSTVNATQADVIDSIYEINPDLTPLQRCMMICFKLKMLEEVAESLTTQEIDVAKEDVETHECRPFGVKTIWDKA